MIFYVMKYVSLDFLWRKIYNQIKDVSMMNKNAQASTGKVEKSEKGLSPSDYRNQLEKIAENAIGASSKFTYYFEDRDSNKLRNVIASRIPTSDFTKYHKHDFFEMNFVLNGSLYENIGGKSFVLSRGDLLFMSPSIYHTCCTTPDAVCYNILFKKEFLSHLSKEYEKYDPGNYLTSISSNEIYQTFSLGEQAYEITEFIENLCEMSIKINRYADLYENLIFENVAEKFLLLLTKQPRHEYSPLSKGKRHDSDFTHSDMVKYVYDNFDKISLPDAAARFGYSKSQFHRIIRQETGMSFIELIRSIRMQRARHYLLNTHLPIKNIAQLLGLDSAEYFSRMFKKNRGMTPKEYREQFMRVSLRKTK